jgi:hypothetical protein
MNRGLLAALEPGGRLAIIDFEPRPGSELPAEGPAERGDHGVHAVETIPTWDGTRGLLLVLFGKP